MYYDFYNYIYIYMDYQKKKIINYIINYNKKTQYNFIAFTCILLLTIIELYLKFLYKLSIKLYISI